MSTSPIRTSENVNEFAAAFAAAQKEFKTVAKTRQGKIEGESKGSGKAYSFTYAYADIADVLEMALPIVSSHGIATMQPTVMSDGVLTIVTRLTHSSGQWMESDYPVCSIQGDHKKMGGALTYARRYALCSMLGIAPDEDIDGNGAEEMSAPQRPAQRPQEQRRPPVEVTSRLDHGRAAPTSTPFDDAEIPFSPNSGTFEPAVSTKAIALGREFKSLRTTADIEALKRTPEFKDAWREMNAADREHVTTIAKEMSAAFAKADLMMAG